VGDPLVRARLQGPARLRAAWAATASPRHRVLTRRSLSDLDDLAFFYCHVSAGRPVTLAILVKVAEKR
jgi:hypothetical protein